MVNFFNLEEEKRRHFLIKKEGHYLFYLFNFQGKLWLEIMTKNCQVFILGIFVGRNKDHFQIETIQDHKVGQNSSQLLIKGVFFDHSQFLYDGLIRISEGASLSQAYQKNHNLILSANAFVESRPFLEIKNNDVFCTHGSSSGRLNKEQIYYLATRGLSLEKASHLLIEGFLNEVFLKMTSFLPKEKVNSFYQRVMAQIPKKIKYA